MVADVVQYEKGIFVVEESVYLPDESSSGFTMFFTCQMYDDNQDDYVMCFEKTFAGARAFLDNLTLQDLMDFFMFRYISGKRLRIQLEGDQVLNLRSLAAFQQSCNLNDFRIESGRWVPGKKELALCVREKEWRCDSFPVHFKRVKKNLLVLEGLNDQEYRIYHESGRLVLSQFRFKPKVGYAVEVDKRDVPLDPISFDIAQLHIEQYLRRDVELDRVIHLKEKEDKKVAAYGKPGFLLDIS